MSLQFSQDKRCICDWGKDGMFGSISRKNLPYWTESCRFIIHVDFEFLLKMS